MGAPVNHINQIYRTKEFLRIHDRINTQISELKNLIVNIQQIPSPTFQETKRAKFLKRKFNQIGLLDTHTDRVNNIYGRIPGKNLSANSLVVSAHLDSVFSADTDLSIKKQGNNLYGPGIGDNATGVAGLVTIAKLIKESQFPTNSDIWFVGNTCEEGLGDLRGMRAAVEKFGRSARYVVIEGGALGQVIHQAIGVKRLRIAINTPGGHSWGNFGEKNAIHEIGHIISEITSIQVSESPKTTFNVGVIEGGSTVNSIASSASILIDLRSEDNATLDRLVEQVKTTAQKRVAVAKRQNKIISVEIEEVGNRPSGHIPSNNDLVKLAKDALRHIGYPIINNVSGSTDANIPLSLSIPAVCVGLTHSGNSHRLDEYIELPPLNAGLHQLMLLVLAASNY